MLLITNVFLERLTIMRHGDCCDEASSLHCPCIWCGSQHCQIAMSPLVIIMWHRWDISHDELDRENRIDRPSHKHDWSALIVISGTNRQTPQLARWLDGRLACGRNAFSPLDTCLHNISTDISHAKIPKCISRKIWWCYLYSFAA